MKRLFITNWSEPEEFWHNHDTAEYDLLRLERLGVLNTLKNIFRLFKKFRRYRIIYVKGFVLEVLILKSILNRNRTLILTDFGLGNQVVSPFRKWALKSYLSQFKFIHVWTPKLRDYIQVLVPNKPVVSIGIAYSYTENTEVMGGIQDCTIQRNQEILSVGRTFRDHQRFIDELRCTNYHHVVIGARRVDLNLKGSQCIVIPNLPYKSLLDRMKACRLLVVPLVKTDFSVGMRVIHMAMLNRIPIIFSHHDDTTYYFQDHEFYELLTFDGSPGGLRLGIKGYLENGINEKLIDYNYRYVITKHGSKRFIQEFNSKVTALGIL